ncbi:thioredoxin family protein [Allochromatium humboldtianum]|uniref:Thioredoxin family protein n=1 Tax=Allochromatium humboldtianum TaxID=504901 RepID=A0A850RGF0_9GAMM|nr:thioredoxin family protein [Allochromatium humboldtianum]NVZ10487.1 thioredoxin family protein [Allochromatium humboldtianum]
MTHTTLLPRLARIGLMSACLLLAAPSASAAELPSASPETVEQALNSGRPTILDLGARACIPCKRMAPILAGLAETYRERVQVLFIDLHEDEQAIKTWRIQMYPTQIFFDAQGREVKRHIGFMDEAALVAELAALGVE